MHLLLRGKGVVTPHFWDPLGRCRRYEKEHGLLRLHSYRSDNRMVLGDSLRVFAGGRGKAGPVHYRHLQDSS